MGRSALFGALLFGGCALASVSHAATPVTAAIPTYTEEQRGPLDAVNAFFAAVEAKRREQILAAVVPEGLATLVRLHDGASPTLVSWHWASYVEDVVAGGDRYTERIFNAHVLIERDMAMVWGPFAVYANGKFSHAALTSSSLSGRADDG